MTNFLKSGSLFRILWIVVPFMGVGSRAALSYSVDMRQK